MLIYFNYQKFSRGKENVLIISCYHSNPLFSRTVYRYLASKLKPKDSPSLLGNEEKFDVQNTTGEYLDRLNKQKKARGLDVAAALTEEENSQLAAKVQDDINTIKKEFIKTLQNIGDKYFGIGIHKILFSGDINLGFPAQIIIPSFLFDSTIQDAFPQGIIVSRVLESSTRSIVEHGISYAETLPHLNEVVLREKNTLFRKIFGNFSFKNELNLTDPSPIEAEEELVSSTESLKIATDSLASGAEISPPRRKDPENQNPPHPNLNEQMISVKNAMDEEKEFLATKRIHMNVLKTEIDHLQIEGEKIFNGVENLPEKTAMQLRKNNDKMKDVKFNPRFISASKKEKQGADFPEALNQNRSIF